MVVTEALRKRNALDRKNSEDLMKVYFAPQSRAVRTVWLLEEIGLPYELEKFQLGQKEMRGPEIYGYKPQWPSARR